MSKNKQLTFANLSPNPLQINSAGKSETRGASSRSTTLRLRQLKSTQVFKTYWKFAAKRQELFFARIEHPDEGLWTDDPILQEHKFTNAYRASDRVSQYLIRQVIYGGNFDLQDTVFRILLFKFFNKIETWEHLERQLGPITWSGYDYSAYDNALTKLLDRKQTIYSAAYIMASGRSAFGESRKHRNHLKIIQKMMDDRLPDRIYQSPNLKYVYETLIEFPAIGPFFGFQLTIDLNYSEILQFDENDFVVAGPGALDGIRKCFEDTGDMSAPDIIRFATDYQHEAFDDLGIDFRDLWGRPLHLIDCQNLFCEVDKYARVAHPEITGKSGRKRIKQKFRPNLRPISYWYPPKWGLNEKIAGTV